MSVIQLYNFCDENSVIAESQYGKDINYHHWLIKEKNRILKSNSKRSVKIQRNPLNASEVGLFVDDVAFRKEDKYKKLNSRTSTEIFNK